MKYLNPWIIEVQGLTDSTIRINIVCRETGEIRQIDLDVDCIAAIHSVEKLRLLRLGEVFDDGEEMADDVDRVIGYEAPQ